MSKTQTDNQLLYEVDFNEWAIQTAQLLRDGRFEQIEIDTLASEIEDMSRNDYNQLKSRIEHLILHLLKWKYQPHFRTRSWSSSIIEQRSRLEDLFETSPSLLNKALRDLPKMYLHSLRKAVVQTNIPFNEFPVECPFALDQAFHNDFWPD